MTKLWRLPLFASLIIGGSCYIAPAAATDSQPLDSIVAAAASASEQRARQSGYDKVSVEVRSLDPRLRLPRCQAPLASSVSHNSDALGALSVEVSCTGIKPWTIYVRTQVTAQVAIPTLARPLTRNSIIAKTDLKLVNRAAESASAGVIYDPSQIIGMALTRPLNAGSTIKASHLRPPTIIKRGQHVTLVAGENGLEVRIQGKALSDAAAGERISVSNLSSGKQVEGIARSDGTVSVQ